MTELAIDVTPLQSEHRWRGVGVYVRELVSWIEREAPLKPVYLASTVARDALEGLVPPERTVYLYRPHRPAQVYWVYNEAFLRQGLRKTRPKVFFAPDFNGLVLNPHGKTVAALHDLSALKLARENGHRPFPPSLSEGLSALRWRVYYRKLARVDHIIARSETVKADAMQLLGIPPEKLSVVCQGLNRALFTPSTGKGPYATHPPYFVHLGGRNANKNQARILEAFARIALEFPEVHLYFAGPWNPSDLRWLEAERQRLGLADRVRHLGYVRDEEVSSLYGNAVALVFPSLEEGYGLPVLEAMASGGPVITSNRSSMPELAGEAAMLVDPLSVTEIARAMRALLVDPALRERYRQLGLRRAAAYSWQAFAEETLRVLVGLL
ncbi:glycosyltransferase family 4 protein [Marinithermus hydrothermalis]|uniref:Glycosyl transferase group 1 n=1 Tax=Marinithermus hydrothermalis (strain DSM 14884 / JCM 11576 / T1) TaxID=869210 RepID=F2NKE9_MARHT|nr:glycosyltransferase family 1 protein [Marinithermus hydrothermalis]AEB12398.1 glycosyl transferase group 1 [Marinithermus hydrothermalis DSM 14884]